MLKTIAAVLLIATAYAGTANAGGGAESVPDFGYTDLPPYRPWLLVPCAHRKHVCDHARWH